MVESLETNNGFPPFPPSLEIRNNSGFPHSHSSDDDFSYIKVKPKNLALTLNHEGGPN